MKYGQLPIESVPPWMATKPPPLFIRPWNAACSLTTVPFFIVYAVCEDGLAHGRVPMMTLYLARSAALVNGVSGGRLGGSRCGSQMSTSKPFSRPSCWNSTWPSSIAGWRKPPGPLAITSTLYFAPGLAVGSAGLTYG